MGWMTIMMPCFCEMVDGSRHSIIAFALRDEGGKSIKM